MATNVTVSTSYTTDNINNSDKTSSSGAVYSSNSAVGDTPERILEKLLTVDSDDSGLNANTLQGKTAADFATNDFVNTKLSKDGGAMNNTNRVTNLNADLLHGHSMVDSGNNWGGITYIGSDGVMEVGKYLDFHNTDTATSDFDNRLESGEWGKLYLNNSVIWHSGNDGAGSGLDSDSIDGYQGSSIMASKRLLVNNENLDNLKEIGSYCNHTGNGSGNSNFPTNYGIIDVSGDGGNYGGIQSSYDANNGDLSYRMNWGGWQPWRKVWNDKNSNLPTVDWTANNLTFSNSIQGDTTFISGFKGSGMRLNKDANNKYNLELDNLTVRGGMNVYELTVNKVRATNGALYVSDSCKIKNCYVEPNNGYPYWAIFTEDTNTFQVGDVVKCQVYSDNGVKCYIFKIFWVDSTSFACSISQILQGGTGANIPAIGDTLVRIASDVANRQGNIYLTSSEANSPYIQIVDNATSANLAGDIKVRLGKLDGITSTAFGSLAGYGLYTNNAVLENARVSGNISATSGNIGGFDIASSSLSTNYVDLNNTTKSIDLYNTNGNVNSGIRFYYGEKNATPSYVARLNAYRHDIYGDVFSIFVSNKLNISANSVKMSGSLYVTDTTTTNDLSISNTTTTNDLYVYNNTVIYGNLSVNGISNININMPTTTLTYDSTGAWPSFSSMLFNGRREGKTNTLTLTFYSSNSSASWQKLWTITNYVSPGYDVYFTPTTGSAVGENSAGYIATTGEIFIKPGKGGQTYYGQVTWITA